MQSVFVIVLLLCITSCKTSASRSKESAIASKEPKNVIESQTRDSDALLKHLIIFSLNETP